MLERLKKSLDENGFIIHKNVSLNFGKPSVIQVAVTTRKDIAIATDFVILGRGLTKVEDNPENRAMLAEHFAFPKVTAMTPFKEVIWAISTDLKGRLILSFDTMRELSSINRPGLMREKEEVLWQHSIPLIVKARNPNHIWTLDSLDSL